MRITSSLVLALVIVSDLSCWMQRCMAYMLSNLLFQYCFRVNEIDCCNMESVNSFAATTHDQRVFSFYPDDQLCNGFEEVLSRYREIVPRLNLAG
jgi:hypothetical protein